MAEDVLDGGGFGGEVKVSESQLMLPDGRLGAVVVISPGLTYGGTNSKAGAEKEKRQEKRSSAGRSIMPTRVPGISSALGFTGSKDRGLDWEYFPANSSQLDMDWGRELGMLKEAMV